MRARVMLWLSGLLVLAGLGPAAAFGAARGYVVPEWSPVPAESPWAAALADLDGDGSADLAVVDRTHDAVTVLLAGSSGALTTKGSYPSPDAPMAVTAGDFDDDGDADVAVADSTGGDVTVMYNDGDGALTAGTQVDLGEESPEIRVNIATADLDGDDDLDLVVNNAGLVVLRNGGAGDFEIAGTYDESFTPNGLALADLDGDHDADVATADGSNRVVIMLNGGTGTLALADGSPFSGGSGLLSIIAADLDGDDDVDLATINVGPPGHPGTAAVLLNGGSAQFTRPADRIVALNGNPGAFDAGDLDGDGDLDLAIGHIAGVEGAHVELLHNDGTGRYTSQAVRPLLDPSLLTVVMNDFDRDGALDIAVAGVGREVIDVLLSRPDGDGDTVADELDNCVATTNIDQLDSDGDGTGNACDPTPLPDVIETTQLAGSAGCVMETPAIGGCAEGRNLSNAWGLTMSPDGRNVYAAAFGGVATFDRDPATGALTQKAGSAGCIGDTEYPEATPPGCADGHGIAAGEDIEISRDGKNVYVTSRALGSIAVLDRDPDSGALSQDPGTDGCLSEGGLHGCRSAVGVGGPLDLTLSPDGHNVYVASQGVFLDSDRHAIAVFDRSTSGDLTQKAGSAGCIWEMAYHDDRCRQGRGLIRAAALAVSPDGEQLYVASLAFGAVAVLDRDASGALSQRAGESACIAENGFLPWEPDEPRECRDGHGIDYPLGLAVSPDGKQLYVSGYGVATLNVQPDGSLTQSTSRSACITWRGSFNCDEGRALGGAYRIALSPNGDRLYAGASSENALAVFTRDTDTGRLVQQGGVAGCISALDTDGRCQEGRALTLAGTGIAVSPDGANIYVTSAGLLTINGGVDVTFSEGAIAAFGRLGMRHAPTAIALDGRTVAENSAPGTAVGTLSSTDPDVGNTHTYALASGDGDADNGKFTIDGTTLKLTPTPDFEAKAQYAIRIRATDQTGLSFEQAFTIAVTNVNEAPAIAIAAFGSCGDDTSATGSVPFTVADPDAGDTLTVTAASSNTTILPQSGVTLSGTGATRSVRISANAKKTGTAVVTLQVADSKASKSSVTITVSVGSAAPDSMNGTSGADLIFGLGGANVLNGGAGNDVICGGIGDDRLGGGAGADSLGGGKGIDRLTGGADGDRFSGGAGADVNVDFDASSGDVTDGS